jgi:hypothetical protein
MATVALGQNFGLSLPRLKDDVNSTLEYTAPYGLFGDQEIVLITFPGQCDVGRWINLECEAPGCRRDPAST